MPRWAPLQVHGAQQQPATQPAKVGIFRGMTDTAELPPCPSCNSPYTYEQGPLLVCPECAYEWTPAAAEDDAPTERVVRDATGNVLADGDTVTVIKDLKVKGSSLVVKVGTKVRNIRLTDGDHDIDCRIDGIGSMGLKSEFVRKA
jgi:protein PhnA